MRIALLLALVLLLAAACGSNGDSGDQSPGGKPTTTQKDEGYNYP